MRRLLGLIAKAWALYRANGMDVLVRRVGRYVQRHGFRGILLDLDNHERFRRWLRMHEPSLETLRRMRLEVTRFRYKPIIDVVMPVCDPDLQWLQAAVRSVRDQVYPHWRLCIADDASSRTEIREYLEWTEKEDSRISVVRRGERGGISAATNTALTLAQGEFACFVDHDDELTPHALYRVVEALNDDSARDLIYSDECAVEITGQKTDPRFKPDFSPDLLMSMNYIGHLVVCRSSLLRKMKGLRSDFDGSQDYDLLLRVTEVTDRIYHIPDILYYWRRIPGSSSGDEEAKPYAYASAIRALEEAAERRGFPAEVTMTRPGRYRVRYILREMPLVSVIIPTRNRRDLLEHCISSIREKTTYRPYEIIILDNESNDESALRYLQTLEDEGCRVVGVEGAFNWSSMNNFGASLASGEYLLFLNNDTEVLSPQWLHELVAQAQRPQVGAVGAKLLFPDGRIQHAGVLVGMGGVAGHAFFAVRGDGLANFDWTAVVRNVSAVTGACMLTKRALFNQIGSFREDLKVSYNDVDYCLRLIKSRYTVVWSPYALLTHHGSASRGDRQPHEDERRFLDLWRGLAGDQYVNPNLNLDDTILRIDFQA